MGKSTVSQGAERIESRKKLSITDVYWQQEGDEIKQRDFLPEYPINLYVETKNYEENDLVSLSIKDENGRLFKGGKEQLNVSGRVDGDGVMCKEGFCVEYEKIVQDEIVARGKVYFDKDGKEIECIKSNTEFETWVESEAGQGTLYKGKYYEKAIMPKIIHSSEHSPRHKVYYQQYDHEIASLTHLFNRWRNGDKDILKSQKIFPLQYTETQVLFKLPIFNTKAGSVYVGGGNYTIMPSELDPTLVKAICMRESRCNIGQRINDIMQVNNSGDWVDAKKVLNLSKGVALTPMESIKAGILWLYAKGIMNAQKYYIKNLKWTSRGWGYQSAQYADIVSTQEKNSAELNIFSWKKNSIALATGAIDSDWQLTTRDYNGSSAKEEYITAVDKYYKEATIPQTSDYYVDNKNYIIP